MAELNETYKAVMVLSGVGDAVGYNNGEWEFCYSGSAIHEELKKLGGLANLDVKGWRVSDDTVLHIATAEALVSDWSTTEELFCTMAAKYKEAFAAEDIWERAPGFTTTRACSELKPLLPQGYIIPFNPSGGGCGAAMRAMCIGLMFPHEDQLEMLIEVAVESGRMTHNHPTGYLGSVAAALLTSYAIQRKSLESWGAGLISTLPKVWEYINKVNRDVKENKENWDYFTNKWKTYLELREISDGTGQPKFPEKYGIPERDVFYKSVSYSGWGGASGHDAPMIAYDALLRARESWSEFCSGAMFHGGDSDSTGVIAAAWWGGLYGMKDVPPCNYNKLEFREKLEKLAEALLKAAESRHGK